MSEKRRSDEIDGDFRSSTLSLSTPLPPLRDKVPVSEWVREYPFDVADWGDRDPRYPGGEGYPGETEYKKQVAARKKPRYSGALFPKKPPAI